MTYVSPVQTPMTFTGGSAQRPLISQPMPRGQADCSRNHTTRRRRLSHNLMHSAVDDQPGLKPCFTPCIRHWLQRAAARQLSAMPRRWPCSSLAPHFTASLWEADLRGLPAAS